MIKTQLFLIFCVSFCCGSTYRKCNVTLLNGETCPQFSYCSQRAYKNGEGSRGECVCNPLFTRNSDSQDDNDYCIQSEKGSDLMQVNVIEYSKPGPSHHDIIGGILIPICVVVIVLSLIYGIKKLNVIHNIRNIISRKHHRPTYEDVVMGHDLDDPPLV